MTLNGLPTPRDVEASCQPPHQKDLTQQATGFNFDWTE
jgi:hypothetical protein